jgi:hypothetical protein
MTSSISNSDPVPSGSRRPLPKSFLLALAVILAVEGSVYIHTRLAADTRLDKERFYPPDRVPSLEESIIQWQIYHLTNLREKQEVILLGDSSCLMGLRPTLITEKTKLKTWGFGTVGWLRVKGHIDILRKSIRLIGPPRLLVYHVSVYPLCTPWKEIRKVEPWLNRYHEWVDPALRSTHWLPSFRFRQTLREAMVPRRFTEGFLTAPRAPFPSDSEVRDILWKERGVMTEPRAGDWKAPPSLSPAIQPYAEGELRELFELADRSGFDVLLMMEPLPEIARTPGIEKAFERMEQDLRRLSRRYPRVFVYSPLPRYYPNSLCSSVTHLLAPGAVRNSLELSSWILNKWPGYARD